MTSLESAPSHPAGKRASLSPALRFHIALGCADVEAAVADYRARLAADPVVVVPGEYALFRTAELNVSIRRDDAAASGRLRHLGWEDPSSRAFAAERDALGIVWERFSAAGQADEIEAAWPGTDCTALRRD
jgi:catechol 2,3-dioxygenase-like lactoylglutathione lyase family enzyme